MKKKLIALLCALCLLLALLAACAKDEKEKAPVEEKTDEPTAQTEPEPDEPSEQPSPEDAEPEHYKIGLMYYDLSIETFANSKHILEKVAEELNTELFYVECNTPDTYMTGLENAIASGVDGFLALNTGNMTQQMLELCVERDVYMATGQNDISGDPGFADYTADNDYFCGWTNNDMTSNNYKVAKLFGEMGAKSYVIQTLPNGVAASIDLAYQGFVDGIADAGGELLGEGRSFNHADTAQNLITQFPDTDAYLCNDFQYVYQPLMNIGRAGDMLVNGMYCITAVREAMEKGHIMCVSEGNCMGEFAAFLLLYNGVSGHNLNPKDGSGGCINTRMFQITDYDELMRWDKYMIEGDPFPLEDIKQYLGAYNSEASFADLKEWVENWTLQEVVDRLG